MCCELLTITNQVNKLLQSSSMQLDIVVRLIDSAKSNLTKYRQSVFDEAVSTAYDALKKLEVTFFNSVVDSSLMSMQERFETMNQVKEKCCLISAKVMECPRRT